MTAYRPAQGAIERECAAGIEHIVKVGAGEVNHKRGRSWSRLIGNRPLRSPGGNSTGEGSPPVVRQRRASPKPEDQTLPSKARRITRVCRVLANTCVWPSLLM